MAVAEAVEVTFPSCMMQRQWSMCVELARQTAARRDAADCGALLTSGGEEKGKRKIKEGIKDWRGRVIKSPGTTAAERLNERAAERPKKTPKVAKRPKEKLERGKFGVVRVRKFLIPCHGSPTQLGAGSKSMHSTAFVRRACPARQALPGVVGVRVCERWRLRLRL